MEAEYKFQVDYAKSGRSSCTKCRTYIPESSLRIARLIQAANFDGKIPKWFHFRCFFTKKANISSVSEIKYFDSIRWEDQEKIRSLVNGSDVVDVGSRSAVEKVTIKLSLPGIHCKACDQDLINNRYSIQEGLKDLVHLDCFLKGSTCPLDISTITGFKKLKKVDQEAVRLIHSEVIKKNKKRAHTEDASVNGAKKSKRIKLNGDTTATTSTVANGDDKDALRLQSKKVWSIRDKLEREVSKDALIGLLEYNEQHVPSGLSNLLSSVSDAMVFGALPTCPSCKNGPLRYSNGEFKCTAMATDWAACMFRTLEPKRLPFRVPAEYHDVDFLKNYKYVPRVRLFASDSARSLAVCPLKDLSFFIFDGSDTNESWRKDIAEKLQKLGASVVEKLGVRVNVICTEDDMDAFCKTPKSFPSLVKARTMRLRVVSDKFLAAVQSRYNGFSLEASVLDDLLKEQTLSGWEVKTKSLEEKKIRASYDPFTSDSSVNDPVRLTYKGGAVVDPDSGLEEKATVLMDSNNKPLSAVLGMVDLVKGSNSYYRLQALVSDVGRPFWLFRAWGRIGTTIGGTKLEKFTTRNSACNAFEALYFDKTGNEWSRRSNFQKMPYKFYEMELDYNDVEQESKNNKLAASIKSNLHPSLQSLIEFICDIESMKRAMVEFELDMKKLPLGKLSKRQINEAYAVLSGLAKLVGKSTGSGNPADQTTLLSESTHFYTLIPHDFGMHMPPLLDNEKLIKQKLHMLEDLCEIELAYNMLRDADEHNRGSSVKNPIDVHYERLNTNLSPLERTSEEFLRIVDYVKRTHAATHTDYKLEVTDVFEVIRPGEKAAMDNYSLAQHNKRLLWHGSRRTNWVGILSQGLRIAPPEAPVTGYMFGKGIYFADLVSKSANYCFSSRSSPEGVLMLCEVLLGDMDKCYNANDSRLSKNKHSRMGVGKSQPDPSSYYTDSDGVIYPIGDPVPSDATDSSLLYNEFIVYNTSQVRQRYLVRVNFLYN